MCGNAALYFDPLSPQDIAEKAAAISPETVLRKELIAAGLKQSRKFSWEKCAKETLEALAEAARA